MIAIQAKLLTVEEFLQLDNEDLCMYELVHGSLVRMTEPSSLHEEIVKLLDSLFTLEYKRLKLNWTTRRRNVLLKEGQMNVLEGRRPDLAVIDKPDRWRESEIEQGIRSIPHLIVEVASSNWSNDLVDKQEEYQRLGVPEYWIVDYVGQIPAKYCKRGKGKKVFVLVLVNGLYETQEYLPGETIPCKTFPNLHLTVDEILNP